MRWLSVIAFVVLSTIYSVDTVALNKVDLFNNEYLLSYERGLIDGVDLLLFQEKKPQESDLDSRVGFFPHLVVNSGASMDCDWRQDDEDLFNEAVEFAINGCIVYRKMSAEKSFILPVISIGYPEKLVAEHYHPPSESGDADQPSEEEGGESGADREDQEGEPEQTGHSDRDTQERSLSKLYIVVSLSKFKAVKSNERSDEDYDKKLADFLNKLRTRRYRVDLITPLHFQSDLIKEDKLVFWWDDDLFAELNLAHSFYTLGCKLAPQSCFYNSLGEMQKANGGLEYTPLLIDLRSDRGDDTKNVTAQNSLEESENSDFSVQFPKIDWHLEALESIKEAVNSKQVQLTFIEYATDFSYRGRKASNRNPVRRLYEMDNFEELEVLQAGYSWKWLEPLRILEPKLCAEIVTVGFLSAMAMYCYYLLFAPDDQRNK